MYTKKMYKTNKPNIHIFHLTLLSSFLSLLFLLVLFGLPSITIFHRKILIVKKNAFFRSFSTVLFSFFHLTFSLSPSFFIVLFCHPSISFSSFYFSKRNSHIQIKPKLIPFLLPFFTFPSFLSPLIIDTAIQ